MMEKDARIAEAQQLGKKAFGIGISNAPALDADMMAMLQRPGMKIGESVPLLKAWHRGWALANLEMSNIASPQRPPGS
jgi:hypothetical protein